MKNNERWVYVDLLRVLAIYLVLVVHVLDWPLTPPVKDWGFQTGCTAVCNAEWGDAVT
jgi:peptidoglycan/LPS O-acetylase OafA/YrhL